MATFFKAQASSLTATAVDYLVTFLLQILFHWSMTASILGTVSGGVVNFTMNRSWVFDARNKNVQLQAVKYIVVWLGNLVLVTTGVYAVTKWGGFSLMAAKITVSLIVGFFYNYILQKRFVFK